jgi:hypothetical protein
LTSLDHDKIEIWSNNVKSDASEVDIPSYTMSEMLTESGCAFSVGSDNFVWITYECNFVALILLKKVFLIFMNETLH